MSPLPRVLVLHANYHPTLSFYTDWREAFARAVECRTELVDLVDPAAHEHARRRIREHDMVVLLHSLTADSLGWVRPLEPALLERGGARLLAIIGNEYNAPRSHLGMRERIAFLRRVRPDWIGTQLDLEAGRWLYAEVPGARVVAMPHGLNPVRFQRLVPDERRSIDIGARSARYLPYLGDADRVRLLERFERGPLPLPLRVDVALGTKRLPPEGWAGFLNDCRGTVATEAGTAYLERDDRTANAVADFLARRSPSLLLFGLEKRLPPGWLQRRVTTLAQSATALLISRGHPGADALYARADLEEVEARFFRGRSVTHSGKCLSSRHFDAIGTGTCQLMFPGRFNGILEAGRHYIPVAPDFSDLAEALRRFSDPAERARIASDALELALSAHTLAHRIRAAVSLLG